MTSLCSPTCSPDPPNLYDSEIEALAIISEALKSRCLRFDNLIINILYMLKVKINSPGALNVQDEYQCKRTLKSVCQLKRYNIGIISEEKFRFEEISEIELALENKKFI